MPGVDAAVTCAAYLWIDGREAARREEEEMNSSPAPTGYELRFRSLFHEGRGVAFPCDAAGHVDLDALGPRALATYLYARTVVGRDFACPAVQPVTH